MSNEDYRQSDAIPAEEKAEYSRIYREALQGRHSRGTVHVYILDPDGHPIDSLHVATASKVEQLTAMLERTVEKLHVPSGEPLVRPAPQSVVPKVEDGTLALHLVARTLKRHADELLPARAVLGVNRSGSWGAYPAEDWIVLRRDDWKKLLPAQEPKIGATWELDRDVAAKMLRHFYPSTENNDISKNGIDELTLKGKVLAVEKGVARARLDGTLKMKHPFYHKDDDNFVEASIVGVLEFEPQTMRVRSLELVTDQASYGRVLFGVAVRTVP